jgi:hypothetical protein
VYEKFTDRAKRVLELANQEAQRFNHEYIGTEHILLGLIKEGSGVAANVLKNLNIDLRKIRREVEKIVQTGPDIARMETRPQTPNAKKVIEYAVDELKMLQHNYLGTEHLLLGLIRVDEGVAAQVLINLGISYEVVGQEVLNLLRQSPGQLNSGTGSARQREESQQLRALPQEIQNEVAKLDQLLAQLGEEKEDAIAEQEFEKAPTLQEGGAVLRKRRKALIRIGVETQKDRQLEQEVAAISAQIQDLLAQRDQAIAAADFDRAIELAAELDRLRTGRKNLIFGGPGHG